MVEWTKRELEILKERYPKCGTKIPELSNRSRGSIWGRAIRLGIKYEKLKRFSEDEIRVLKEEYPELGTIIPELLNNGHTRGSIKRRAGRLNIECKFSPIKRKIHIDESELRHLYINKKKSIAVIAKRVGCSCSVIRRNLIECNIPMRSLSEACDAREDVGKSVKITNYMHQILDGLLLGDGSIPESNRKTTFFTICQCEQHKEWIEFIRETLEYNNIKTNVRHEQIRRSPSYISGKRVYGSPQSILSTRFYTNFRAERERWYPNGKKIVPMDIKLTSIVLAQWYMGDGCLSEQYYKGNNCKRYRLILACQGFNKDGRQFLLDELNTIYGYHSRLYGNGLTLQYQKDIIDFLRRTLPHKVNCFDYKWRALGDILSYRKYPNKYLLKSYTKEEIKILKERYSKFGSSIPELLNNDRTRGSIQAKANQLGIKHISYTQGELRILKEKYPGLGSNIPELLNAHSRNSIKERARKLGIKYKALKYSFYTENEINIIRKKYPRLGTRIPELLDGGRTHDAIQKEASELGIKYCGYCGLRNLK